MATLSGAAAGLIGRSARRLRRAAIRARRDRRLRRRRASPAVDRSTAVNRSRRRDRRERAGLHEAIWVDVDLQAQAAGEPPSLEPGREDRRQVDLGRGDPLAPTTFCLTSPGAAFEVVRRSARRGITQAKGRPLAGLARQRSTSPSSPPYVAPRRHRAARRCHRTKSAKPGTIPRITT